MKASGLKHKKVSLNNQRLKKKSDFHKAQMIPFEPFGKSDGRFLPGEKSTIGKFAIGNNCRKKVLVRKFGVGFWGIGLFEVRPNVQIPDIQREYMRFCAQSS